MTRDERPQGRRLGERKGGLFEIKGTKTENKQDHEVSNAGEVKKGKAQAR